MGEIIDFILDFEKKLLVLVRDLIVRPQKIANSIAGKDKTYLSSFKFYTLVTSIWIIVFQVGNRYFDFFQDEYILPNRLQEVFQSERDFAFLIAPFVGLLEFFIPFSLINYFLFRKKNLSLLNHFTLNTYLAGIILLYEIPCFIVLFVLSSNSEASDLMGILTNIFLIALPVIFYGYAHVKIFGKSKILSFLKPIVALLVISFISLSQLLQKPFHEAIHRKIFYSKFNHFELSTTATPGQCSYVFQQNILMEDENQNRFVPYGIPASIQYGHSYILNSFSKSDLTYSAELVYQGKNNLQQPLRGLEGRYFNLYSVQQLDSQGTHAILVNPEEFISKDSARLWVITGNGEFKFENKSFRDGICFYTRFIMDHGKLYFTGIERKSRLPVIGVLSDRGDVLYYKPLEGLLDFIIDDIQLTGSDSSSASFNLLLSHNDRKKLKEIRWMSISASENSFTRGKEVTIYKNEFTPSLNYAFGFLHNGKLRMANDSTAIIGFQVMTDSSFALNLTSMNTLKGLPNWNSIHIIPADFSFYDQVLTNDHSIFVLGRAVSIFRDGFSMAYYQRPYFQVIDLKNGAAQNLQFLPIDETSGAYEFYNLEDVYNYLTTAYQDNSSIYWNIGAAHSYVIRKSPEK